VINSRYSLWITRSSHSLAMAVVVVGETEKAIKLQVANSDRPLTFFLPKAAVKIDTKNEGILLVARWFNAGPYLMNLLDKFANYYRR
jgi:hypothetical protein